MSKSRLCHKKNSVISTVKFDELPQELHYIIADNLDIKSATRLSLVSSSLFSHLGKDNYLKGRTAFIESLGIDLIEEAIEAIKLYLKQDKAFPGEILSSIINSNGRIGQHGKVNYDKGYHRANCFMDILNNQFLSIRFRIFVIFSLLNEKNGDVLKSKVRKNIRAIIKSTEGDIFNLLAVFVAQSYQGKLINMQIELLHKIHHCYQQYANSCLYQEHGPYEQIGGHGLPIFGRSEDKRVSLVTDFWRNVEHEICEPQNVKSMPKCNLM